MVVGPTMVELIGVGSSDGGEVSSDGVAPGP